MNTWKRILLSKKFWLFSAVFVITTGASCSITGGNENQIIGAQVELEMWTIIDSPQDYQSIITSYNSVTPNIHIKVKKFRIEDYEDELLNALAEDRGPDIFMVHNTNLRKNISKIAPLPNSITIPRVFAKGNVTNDIVVERSELNSITPLKIREAFVDTVADDIIIDGKIHGLPLYVDTLALYYNRDLLNQAGFAEPPKYWDQFQSMSGQLTKINLQNNIIQSGAALGTANNIQNAEEIMALLMMQTGAEMVNQNKTAAIFNKSVTDNSVKRNPAVDALRFYSDFARTPPTTAYSWNENQPDNLESFINGKLAFFFGYSYHLPLIKTQTLGSLNFSIAPMVQIQNAAPINIANYWMPTVSKKSENIHAAWHFIQFLASPNEVDKYLSIVNKPTALRSRIEAEKNDEDIFAFSGQSLTAKNWYYGNDYETAKKSFNTMITKALTSVDTNEEREQKLLKLINDTATVINQTYRK